MPSQTPLPVITARPTPNEREHQTDQRGDVLEQHDRQLRRLGAADELPPGWPRPRMWLDSFTAVRNENDSSTIATSSTPIGTHCRVSIGSGCWSLWQPS